MQTIFKRSDLVSLDWIEELAAKAQYRPARMAALWPISLRQLERVFSKRLGKTPERWTRELRIAKAKTLLSAGYSNKAVVGELGFSSDAHLCHEFKTFCGRPPQYYGSAFHSPGGASL